MEAQTPAVQSQGTEGGGETEQPDDVSSGAAINSATTLPGAILFIHLTDKANNNTKYSAVAYDPTITPGTKGSDIIKSWDSTPPYYELFTAPVTGQDKRAPFGQGTGEYYVGMYGTKQGPYSQQWPFKTGNSVIKNGFYMAFWNDNLNASGLFTNAPNAEFGSVHIPVMKLQQGIATKNLITNNEKIKELFVVCYAMSKVGGSSPTLNLAQ